MISLSDFNAYNYATGYLLHMGFPTPIRLCTHSTVTALSETWTHGDFELTPVAESNVGPRELKITLGDTNFTYGATFQSNWTPGLVCEVWLIYFLSTVKTAKLFTGELIGPVIGDDLVTVTASIARYGREVVPRVPFISENSFARGSEVKLGNNVYVIQ